MDATLLHDDDDDHDDDDITHNLGYSLKYMFVASASTLITMKVFLRRMACCWRPFFRIF